MIRDIDPFERAIFGRGRRASEQHHGQPPNNKASRRLIQNSSYPYAQRVCRSWVECNNREQTLWLSAGFQGGEDFTSPGLPRPLIPAPIVDVMLRARRNSRRLLRGDLTHDLAW